MKLKNLKSSSDFVREIETLVVDKNIDFFEAVMHYCETKGIEVETAAALIKQSTTLKAKIQFEAENLNLLKKTARLPI
jgi:Phage late-transcription coactivator